MHPRIEKRPVIVVNCAECGCELLLPMEPALTFQLEARGWEYNRTGAGDFWCTCPLCAEVEYVVVEGP